MKRAASPTWSDGIHFVRKTSPNDSHPMPWTIAAHRVTASTFRRYTNTRAEAIKIAEGATKAWLKANPADRVLVKEATVPPAASKVVRPDHPPFSTANFNCIEANPYAQVWECQREHGDITRGPAGRRAKDGSAPKQAYYRHRVRDCAVLIGKEPVRDKDGQVSVFNGAQASELAYELYLNAPEDEVILWRPGTTVFENDVRVAATGRVEVHFNPAINGEVKPFSLYLPEFKREVFEDRTRPTYYAEDDRPKGKLFEAGQAQIDRETKRRERQELDRQPSFEERPLRFRSIWAAEEEAYRRERMMKGETVL